MSSTLWRARRRGERPVIYGRERERAQLRELLADAIADYGALVLISGEAGIGKTTLVDDLILSAQERDCLVLTGGCYDLTTTPPYGPWVEVLRGYRPDKGGPALPTWFGNPKELAKVGSQAALFEETRAFLAAISEQQPLLVVLEDLHWADSASLDALRWISRTIADDPILLVATYRDDEITRRHSLFQLLPTLVRESNADRVHVSRLYDEGLRQLISAQYALAEDDLAQLTAYVSALADGNALYVVELLRALEDDGVLQPAEHQYVVGPLDAVIVPPFLQQVIERRLARLGKLSHALLEIAAVIGHEVPLDLWSSASGAPDADLVETLSLALAARVLEEGEGGESVRFSHALVREALYNGIVPLHRRSQHRTIAQALIDRSHPNPDLIADHLVRAGDRRAVEWLIRAGDRAERSYAWLTAADYFDRVQDRLRDEPERVRERGWLLFRLGRLLRYTDVRKAIPYLEEAVRITRDVDDPILTGNCEFALGMLQGYIGNFSRSLEEMESGLSRFDAPELQGHTPRASHGEILVKEVIPTPDLVGSALASDPTAGVHPGRGTVVGLLAELGHLRDAVAMGKAYFDKALAIFGDELWQGAGNQPGDGMVGLGWAHALLGEPEQATLYFTRAFAVAVNRQHHFVASLARIWQLRGFYIPFATERVQERRRLEQEATASLERASGAGPLPHLNHQLRVLEGDWDHALANAQSVNFSEQIEMNRDMARITLATLARHRGHPDQAWAVIEQIHPDLSGKPGERPFNPAVEAQRLAFHLALDKGDVSNAHDWLQAHDKWMAWSGAVVGLAEGQLGWARYHRVARDLHKAREYAERAYEHASNPRQPLALIAADRFLGQLDVNEGKYDDAERRLAASLELAERCQAPFEQALTLVVMAERAAKLSEVDEARRLIARVREICEPLGAQPTLDRVDEIEALLPRVRRSTEAHPFGLTAREVEVLRLVARGRTDAEAAEELFISPRTVSQHLRSVYNKLGVNNRAEATKIAVEQGIV